MRRAVMALCLIGFLLIPCLNLHASDTSWLVADAPFRAMLRLKEPAKAPDAGILIDLPEFGRSRADLGDAILVDAKGLAQPLAKIWHGKGGRMLLLARTLDPETSYGVYFGGNAVRTSSGWTPKTSLFMETRRLPDGAKIDSWADMQKTWKSAVETDGAGFVASIFQGENPFGPSTNYVTHYSGWLKTDGTAEMVLYTLSSDASFVLVNNQFEFDWPGIHSPWANLKTVHSKAVSFRTQYTEIDYYHAKTTGEAPGAVLGWKRDDKFETIPPEAWLHPGTVSVEKIEDRRGWPVPIADAEPLTCLGYGGQWYNETHFSLPEPLKEGWTAKWQFEDGATVSGTNFQRVIVGAKSQEVTLALHGPGGETGGVKRFFFPDALPAASVNKPADLARYLDLLANETPFQLARETLEADLALLLDFGTDEQAARFAEAWLQKNPGPRHPLWLPVQVARLLARAQNDARRALDEVKRIDPEARKTAPQVFALLELDLLVFYLQDAMAIDTARRLEFLYPNSETARLAKIRAGDFYRLTGQFKQAVDQYQGIQKTIVDETAGRKLPAQDQAYSITIRNLIGKEMRKEAADKLREWELRHPMAKFDSDFLLLNGRTLLAFGRWNEALTEFDSFKKTQSDSPWQVDADYYRAEALNGLGKKEEAKKIWRTIAKEYPRHELAEKAKKMSND